MYITYLHLTFICCHLTTKQKQRLILFNTTSPFRSSAPKKASRVLVGITLDLPDPERGGGVGEQFAPNHVMKNLALPTLQRLRFVKILSNQFWEYAW